MPTGIVSPGHLVVVLVIFARPLRRQAAPGVRPLAREREVQGLTHRSPRPARAGSREQARSLSFELRIGRAGGRNLPGSFVERRVGWRFVERGVGWGLRSVLAAAGFPALLGARSVAR